MLGRLQIVARKLIAAPRAKRLGHLNINYSGNRAYMQRHFFPLLLSALLSVSFARHKNYINWINRRPDAQCNKQSMPIDCRSRIIFLAIRRRAEGIASRSHSFDTSRLMGSHYLSFYCWSFSKPKRTLNNRLDDSRKIVTKQVICASDEFPIKLPTIERRRRPEGTLCQGKHW